MANTLTATATFAYSDPETSGVEINIPDIAAAIGTKKYTQSKQSIGTSEEAINMGEITAPGWVCLINRDVTNYIEIKVATGGAIFAKLLPGEWCILRLGSGAQAPFAIANSAACLLESLIVNT